MRALASGRRLTAGVPARPRAPGLPRSLRARWGVNTATRIVTTHRGPLVVQHLSLAAADRSVAAATALDAASVAVPRVACVRRRRLVPSLVAWEFVSGVSGADLMDVDGRAVARAMGAIVPVLASVADPRLPAAPAWVSGSALRSAAARWLGRVEDDHLRDAIAGMVARISRSTWVPTVTHGDFVPANALIAGDRVSALVDLEGVARRHPLLDVAWWSFIVAYHHPRQTDTWQDLVDAADLEAASDVSPLLRDLAALRAVELAATAPGAHAARLVAAAVARARAAGPANR